MSHSDALGRINRRLKSLGPERPPDWHRMTRAEQRHVLRWHAALRDTWLPALRLQWVAEGGTWREESVTLAEIDTLMRRLVAAAREVEQAYAAVRAARERHQRGVGSEEEGNHARA